MTDRNYNADESFDDLETQEWIDRIADAFELGWKDSPHPSIDSFLDDSAGERRWLLLCELIRIDLEHRSRYGESLRIESYLDEFPELSATQHGMPDELIVFAKQLADRDGNVRNFRDNLLAATEDFGSDIKTVKCPHCHQPVKIAISTSERSTVCPECAGSIEMDASELVQGAKLRLPRTLGKFQLLEFVGGGTFGTVFKARDCELGRTVAIKFPRPGILEKSSDEQRFFREARATAALRHPNIVQLHEVGREEGVPFIVSDFVDGQTLDEYVADRPLTHREAAEYIRSIAGAIDHAHQNQVIHRDIKPSNVLVDEDGQPFVTDFGLARQTSDRVQMTFDGQVLGTPAYMSPEQATGESAQVDGRCDVYSLGVVLYELLTGDRPFRGNIRMVLQQVVNADPQPPRRLNDRIPRDLETICLKALAKSPARRYQSARDLSDDLGRYLNDEPIVARPVTATERAWLWCRRNPVVSGLSVSLVAAITIGLIVSLIHIDQTHQALIQVGQEKANAEQQTHLAQLGSYNVQLLRAHDLIDIDVERARRMLEDPALCPESFRDFTWRHMLLRTQRRGLTWQAHDEIHQLLFVPSSNQLVSCGNEADIKIWDSNTGKLLRTFSGHSGAINSIAISLDGELLASVGTGDSIRIWALKSGKAIATLVGHQGGTHHVDFSNDRKLLASTGEDETIRVWDLETKQKWKEFDVESSPDNIAFSFDGDFVIATRYGKPPQFLKLQDEDESESARIRNDRPSSLPGVPDIARPIAIDEETIKLMNQSRFLHTHVIYSPTGQHRVLNRIGMQGAEFQSEQGTSFGTRLSAPSATGVPQSQSVRFSCDGNYVAIHSDSGLAIWSTKDLEPATSFREGFKFIDDFAIRGDGKMVATSDAGEITIFSTGTESPHFVLEHEATQINCLSFANDKFLATADGDGQICLWDLNSREVATTVEHGKSVSSLNFDHSGKNLISCSDDVKVWNVDGLAIKRHATANALANEACFSPDEATIATGGIDIKLWSANLKLKSTITGHTQAIRTIAFSPDGKLLATGSSLPFGADNDFKLTYDSKGLMKVEHPDHCSLGLWDAKTGEQLAKLNYGTERAFVNRVVFSPDGKTLAVAIAYAPIPAVHQDTASNIEWSQVVQLWDVEKRLQREVLRGHRERVTDVTFSHDGRTLASGDRAGKVLLWDSQTGQLRGSIQASTRRINSLRFSPDDSVLATATNSPIVKLWRTK